MRNWFFPDRRYRSGMRWCVFRWTHVIPDGETEVYLTRFHILQTPWFSIMLHWLLKADPQPDLHDHPNDFVSLVLRGGYTEERQNPRGGISNRRIRFYNILKAESRHRIVAVKRQTVTLVFANRVRRTWGFWRDGKFIEWREYTHL